MISDRKSDLIGMECSLWRIANMYICIDDIIDAAFEQQDNVKMFRDPDSSFLDEDIRNKLFSLEVAERTNKIISKREELARLERERLLELKRQQIARDLLRKEEAERAETLKNNQLRILHDTRVLANDVVAGVAGSVSSEIAEVVRICYNIVTDLSDMFIHAIDQKRFTLQPSTRWWLGQLSPGLADPTDLRLAVTLDVLREVVNIFSDSGFKISLV